MSAETQDWKAEARELRDQGLSERAIAEAVGKAPSSVHAALAESNGHAPVDPDRLAAVAGDSSGEPYDDKQFFEPAPKLPGFEDLVGGQEPTSTKIRLLGGSVEVTPPEGGFKKGTTYVFRVEARAKGVAFDDVEDNKTGDVIGCTEGRKLKITGCALA